MDFADKLQVLGVFLGIIQMLRGYTRFSLPITVLLGFLFLRKRISVEGTVERAREKIKKEK